MGEEVKVLSVDIENDGTLLQVDFKVGDKKDRMFVSMRDVYKALNNYAYAKHEQTMLANGFELEDPENYQNPNFIF
jgi:hypothetical protein